MTPQLSKPATAQWEPYFAWWPVWVDAYTPAEIKNGKMRYRKLGWVQRQWNDNEFGSWRYRL
jgi:hypothetical protein